MCADVWARAELAAIIYILQAFGASDKFVCNTQQTWNLLQPAWRSVSVSLGSCESLLEITTAHISFAPISLFNFQRITDLPSLNNSLYSVQCGRVCVYGYDSVWMCIHTYIHIYTHTYIYILNFILHGGRSPRQICSLLGFPVRETALTLIIHELTSPPIWCILASKTLLPSQNHNSIF